MDRVGFRLAEGVGAHNLVGHVQFDPLASIRQRAAVIAKTIGKCSVRIVGPEMAAFFAMTK